MFNYIWPLALVVLANTAYQICAKSAPSGVDPFASLMVTYFVGMLVTLLLYLFLGKDVNLIRDIKQLNWTSYALGLAIVGLEAGTLFAYRAGWLVSLFPMVSSAALTVIMAFVGKFLFGETLTPKKIIGLILCVAGITLTNL